MGAIIILIIKNLPMIVAILGGLFSALGRLNLGGDKPIPIDTDAVKALVEKLTLEQISKVVEEHKKEIIPWVPNEEEKARQDRMDELVKQMEEAQAEYEREQREKAALKTVEKIKPQV